MIDYEKLKLVQELFKRLKDIPGGDSTIIYITIDSQKIVYGLHAPGEYYIGYDDIDNLVVRLEELIND